MIKLIFQQTLRHSIILLLLVATGGYLLSSWVDSEIFAPPRKQLHHFHLERLKNPAEFGLHIRQHQCLQGRVPCMLVEPDAAAGLGKRGRILREQLQARGVKLNPYGEVRATLLMLHGRNGRKEILLPVAERFVAAGFRCLIPDLPAHGESQAGRLSFGGSEAERRLPAQVLLEMKQHFALPDQPVALWGMSMGGAFAMSSARESRLWSGLIVVSSFASLDDVLLNYVPSHYDKYADGMIGMLDIARWLQGKPTLSSIRPAKWAAEVDLPALLVHGDNDVYVPMSQGKRLFRALRSQRKQWITVPGGGHRNVLSTPMQLYAAMSEWLLRLFDA
ncbi:MAG: alpha/beta hydrolase [Thiolinea sp.]